MTSFLHVMFGIAVAEFILGNLANAFIVLVNGLDWVKRQKVSWADGILTALAVSRIGLLWVVLIMEYLMVFRPAVYRGSLRLSAGIAWAVTNHFSSWFATVLTIFYVLKIANFSNLAFLHLRRRVKSVTVLVLLGTLVFLFAHIVILYVRGVIQAHVWEGNATGKTELSDSVKFSTAALFTVVTFMPFVTSLACVLLLTYSLCRHLGRMKVLTERPRDASTAVHMKALRSVLSFLLLFTMNSLAIVASSWSASTALDTRAKLFFYTFGLLYPSSHSYILIWGNKKLRQAFSLWAGHVRFWLRD